jgi:hypothetical protein
MRITSLGLDIGGDLFVLMGLLHAIYTLLDIRRPRRLVPDDPAIAAAMARSNVRLSRGGTTMWRAWVGFNLSHSLGAVIFGALCVVLGALVGTLPVPGWVIGLAPAIGLIYLTLGVLYWFRIPVVGIAVATGCLLVAWLDYLAASHGR